MKYVLNGHAVTDVVWEHSGYTRDDESYIVEAYWDTNTEGRCGALTPEECDELTRLYAHVGDEQREDAAISRAEAYYDSMRD